MVDRRCSSCNESLPKECYSKNQWSKGEGNSRCHSCVNPGSNNVDESGDATMTSSYPPPVFQPAKHASSYLPNAFQRAKHAMRRTRFNRRRDDEAQDMAYDAMEARSGPEKIRLAQTAVEHYPLAVEAWGVLGYYYLNEIGGNRQKNLQASIEAFQVGVEAARQVDPSIGPDRVQPLDWFCMEIRPYIRAMRGLAQAYSEVGLIGLAIETTELLAKWKLHALNDKLIGWYLQAGRWDDARKFLQEELQQLKENDYRLNCGTAYARVFLLWQSHADTETLDQALAQALKTNPYVPSMLRNNYEAEERPGSYGSGGEDEAIIYAMDNASLWRWTPGALDWLWSRKELGGAKPSEETFIELLQKDRVLVEFNDRSTVRITQNRGKMLGTALPGFRMPAECTNPHTNGSFIHAQKYEFGVDDKWIKFRYDNVASVPFWSILLALEDEEDSETASEGTDPKAPKCLLCGLIETSTLKLKTCQACKVAKYCSVDCQKADWKRHKVECKRYKESKIWNDLEVESISLISSFLTLKEKAAVRSFNKIWSEGVTLDHSVSIDPEDIGINVDGALRFVTSSFSNLRHFSLRIKQQYFLSHMFEGYGIEHPLQFHGRSLRNLFQSRMGLRSVSLWFDDCVQEHTSRILVEEEGLSTLHQQTSLQSLTLGFPYFESVDVLSDMLRPLINLEHIRLVKPGFPDSEFIDNDRDSLWRSTPEFIATIGALPKLRKLIIHNNGFVDNNILGLAPILPEITELELEGQFGDSFGAEQISLSDASLAFIAENSPKLQSFSVCYNRRVTMEGLWEIIRKCPLRELQASETGLESEHLEEVVQVSPTLRLIRYGRIHRQQHDHHLRAASIASQGRVLFIGPFSLYKPTFDPTLMANHEKTKKFIEDSQNNEEYGN